MLKLAPWFRCVSACSLTLLVSACDPRAFWGDTFLSEARDGKAGCPEDPSACAPCGDGGCMPLDDGGMPVRCKGPDDCPASGACRVDETYPGGEYAQVGACLPPDRVCVVDSANCKAERDGSLDKPYCDIQETIGRCPIVRLRPRRDGQRYNLVTLRAGNLAIFGPGRIAGAVINGAEVASSAMLSMMDLIIERPKMTGVSCTGAGHALLRRVTIRNSDIGVGADGCGRLLLDQSEIRGSQYDGLHLGAGTKEYRVVNTLIAGNARDLEANAVGVYIETMGKGRFAFNTVVQNGRKDGESAGIFCAVATSITDSIVFGNTPGIRGTQLGGSCQLERVAVGPDATTSSGAIKTPPELDPTNFHLTGNNPCCIDTAKEDRSIPWDHEGTPRPQRMAYDIGYHELR